jgi:hypothetical protein
MEVRLDNTVEYIKARTESDLIAGQDLALVGYTLDGKAIYDGRLLDSKEAETEGRVILLDTFLVKDERELLSKVGELGFSEISLLNPGYADVSAACVGVTVSGRLVFSSHRMVSVIEIAGYDGEAGFAELDDILKESDDPLCPIFVRFAPAVRDFYGERSLMGDRTQYTCEENLPKIFHARTLGRPCLVGVTLTKCPVYDAQGFVPRNALEKNMSANRYADAVKNDGIFLIVPSGPDYELELKLGGRTWNLRSFARTLNGRPVFDGSKVLEEVGLDVFRLVARLRESPDKPVLVFGPEK